MHQNMTFLDKKYQQIFFEGAEWGILGVSDLFKILYSKTDSVKRYLGYVCKCNLSRETVPSDYRQSKLLRN